MKDIEALKELINEAEEKKDWCAFAMHYYNLKNYVRVNSEVAQAMHESEGKYSEWMKKSV